MRLLIKTGRLFYGIGIAALGIHQLIIKDFRPEILPAFPRWAHKYTVFPIITGIALLFAGIIISGLFTIKFINIKKICLYLGFFFFAIIITCYLPFMLFISTGKASSLAGWFDVCEALAYCGGAFLMAGISAGRILFSILMIVFGCSHFVYAANVSTMVPKWAGVPMFWTYFVGVALIGAGIAIILRIWIKPVALLLAIMLFGFFLFFHIPDAIANPSAGGGNEIVRSIVALLFCGIALVIAFTNGTEKAIR
jgi:uncharacterized membrane protein YphA (DoxX/SURF4 family)